MLRQQLLDLYFVDARSRLIDIAAFLDRVERAEGDADFRLDAFKKALQELGMEGTDHAQRVLLAFSDKGTEPLAQSSGKGASGAHNPAR